ncbi:hypothetical protein HEP84_28365 [Streptomyces sp. RLB1-33]|uniref:hypothetical protein n=1 Tax=Streptomyces mirabilis TaxID=68239 RepID=UPI00143EC3CB|nr:MULTISPECIES: hypothetical protein [Streptomyces]QIY72470.1 hypothetical protein HEP84_28365 [Streptomyces sp. RLB1-33]QUW80577.1 hypothetical protein SMIR_16735 [Streptomyces mirabilis]
MNGKRAVAGAVIAALAAVGTAGLTTSSASAASLPQHKAAAQHSVTTAQVLSKGAQPQFWHAIAQSVAAATVVKATEQVAKYTTKLPKSSDSSSSSESSSSSSGGPALSGKSLHGVIPGDTAYDAN